MAQSFNTGGGGGVATTTTTTRRQAVTPLPAQSLHLPAQVARSLRSYQQQQQNAHLAQDYIGARADSPPPALQQPHRQSSRRTQGSGATGSTTATYKDHPISPNSGGGGASNTSTIVAVPYASAPASAAAAAAAVHCSAACFLVTLMLLLLSASVLALFFAQNTRLHALEHDLAVLKRQHTTELAYNGAVPGGAAAIALAQSRNALSARFNPPPTPAPPPALPPLLPPSSAYDDAGGTDRDDNASTNARGGGASDEFERLLNAGRTAVRNSRGMTRIDDTALVPTTGSAGGGGGGKVLDSRQLSPPLSSTSSAAAPVQLDSSESHDHYRFTIPRPAAAASETINDTATTEDMEPPSSSTSSGIRIPPVRGSIERFDTKRLLTCHVCCRPEPNVFVCPPADQLSLLVRYSPSSDEHYLRLMVHNRAYYGADCILYWVLDNNTGATAAEK